MSIAKHSHQKLTGVNSGVLPDGHQATVPSLVSACQCLSVWTVPAQCCQVPGARCFPLLTSGCQVGQVEQVWKLPEGILAAGGCCHSLDDCTDHR